MPGFAGRQPPGGAVEISEPTTDADCVPGGYSESGNFGKVSGGVSGRSPGTLLGQPAPGW